MVKLEFRNSQILWNLGIKIDIMLTLTPAIGILFYYLGIMIGHTKRNWFIGIRTPWTLSSDVVWEKTHKIGGKMFKVSGIIVFLGFILPKYAIFFMIVPIIFTSVYTIAYSYFEYRKENSS